MDSLNTTLNAEVVLTFAASSAGEVDTTVGGVVSMPDDELVGEGLPTEKSALLLFVSCPAMVRCADVVLLNVGVAAPSKQLAEPYPTKSTADALGHVPDNKVVELTRATLPVVALIAILPVASGVGRLEVPPVPAASWMR